MPSRPSLSLFPPTESVPRQSTEKNRYPAVKQPCAISSAESKASVEVHELIIQIPEPAHKKPIKSRNHSPDRRAPARRSRDITNVCLDERAQPVETSSADSKIEARPYPARSTSLESNVERSPSRTREPSLARAGPVVSSQTSPTAQEVSAVTSSEEDDRCASRAFSSRKRVRSPASGFSECPTLVRTLSGRTAVRSPDTAQEPGPMRSIFPQYDHHVPLAEQHYVPTHQDNQYAQIPRDKISRAPYHPQNSSFNASRPSSVTTSAELENLWHLSNGTSTSMAAGPRNFALQLTRPASNYPKTSPNAVTDDEVEFGFCSDSKQPFYSLRTSSRLRKQYLETSMTSDQSQQHEVLLLRHHPMRSDILPVAKMDVVSPPMPVLSSGPGNMLPSRSRFDVDIESSAANVGSILHHVTTIEPAIASLAALREAADSPIAVSLARADPSAVSPAARDLAETAIARAKEEESVEVLWHQAGANSGTYKLLHPSLGPFDFSVDGDIAGQFDKLPKTDKIRRPMKIALQRKRPSSRESKTEQLEGPSDQYEISELVSLNFVTGVLKINGFALAELGNPYICDVAVAAVIAVAVAESHRAPNPELIFDAPPILDDGKKTSSNVTTKSKRKAKQASDDWEERELPWSVRLLISVLGFIFKSTLWVVGLGLRAIFRILKGIGSCFKS